MAEQDDIKTSADGWRSFLDKLTLLRREAERRGLTDIVETAKDTAVAVAERLRKKTN
ncbi:hypothetical protein [Telmatospirillum sp.]|uniref:hypothetical protein n=1 Tax=Telmatospirillum sp. TaxID=2079197 RepID=UPI0028439F30|nr:hypothetical protein [Telmatospirillum sp.]MDR3438867.1 hypothetical protein [Telmatospirillum sp.]